MIWSKAHEKSWKTDEHWLKRLKTTFAGKTLAEMPPEAVERFKLALVATHARATVNRHLSLLRHLFNRRIRQGTFTGRNPVSAVGLFREENVRERYLNDDEEARLLAVVPAPYATFCRVALYTGCRLGELLSARWDFIDWNRRLLTVPTSKNGKPRHVELSSLVLEALKAVPRRVDTPFVFADCGTGRTLSHRFPVWAKAAKLPTEGPDKVTFHTLRHTFASRLVMAGVDLLTVQKLGGWGSLAMVQRYDHLAPAHTQAAVEALVRGKRLQPSGTQSGTDPQKPENATMVGIV